MGSKLHIFEDKKVRSYWDPEKEEWFFSAVDVCYVLAAERLDEIADEWKARGIGDRRCRRIATQRRIKKAMTQKG